MRTSLLAVCLVAIGTAAAMSNCSEDTATETKSLRNAVSEAGGNGLVYNNCTGLNLVNGGIKLPPGVIRGATTLELKDAVVNALAAVPASITFAYFQLGGTINLTDDALALCTDGQQENLSDAVNQGTCLVMDTAKLELSITASPNPVAISHGLTRAMGLFYARGLSRAARGTDNNVAYVEQTPDMIAGWANVKKTFLAELAKDTSLTQKTLTTIASQEPERIFAEAFDSMYCSDETRKDWQSYPKTLAAARSLVNQLTHMDTALVTALKTRQQNQVAKFSSTAGVQGRLAALLQWGVEANLQADTGSGFDLVSKGGEAKAGGGAKAGRETVAASKGGDAKGGAAAGGGGGGTAARAQPKPNSKPQVTMKPQATAAGTARGPAASAQPASNIISDNFQGGAFGTEGLALDDVPPTE